MKKVIPCLLLTLLFLLFSACRNNEEEVVSEVNSVASSDIATKENLESGAFEAFALAAKFDTADDTPAFLTRMESLVKVEVLSLTQDGDTAEAKLRISSPDLVLVIESLADATYSSEDEMNKALTSALGEAELLVTELDVKYFYVDGEWEIYMTDEFFNAYYGGVLDIREDLFEELYGGEG